MYSEIFIYYYAEYQKCSLWKNHIFVMNSYQTKAVLFSINDWSIHKENSA